MPITDFPKAGDDKAVTLRNSKYPQFDYDYALALRDEYPQIWNDGGWNAERRRLPIGVRRAMAI